ncbi:MAG TPA: hypothetical protein VHO47_04200 [Candidatus Babeliales bacterium]|nr:hypothetical protein [Candidatus Babeliales bacterium]
MNSKNLIVILIIGQSFIASCNNQPHQNFQPVAHIPGLQIFQGIAAQNETIRVEDGTVKGILVVPGETQKKGLALIAKINKNKSASEKLLAAYVAYLQEIDLVPDTEQLSALELMLNSAAIQALTFLNLQHRKEQQLIEIVKKNNTDTAKISEIEEYNNQKLAELTLFLNQTRDLLKEHFFPKFEAAKNNK